jgi:hypothetical protein
MKVLNIKLPHGHAMINHYQIIIMSDSYTKEESNHPTIDAMNGQDSRTLIE